MHVIQNKNGVMTNVGVSIKKQMTGVVVKMIICGILVRMYLRYVRLMNI